jgi:uncharacterized protein YjiS (DUF1127 family)
MWPYDTYKTAWLGSSADLGRAHTGHRISPAEYAMMARGETLATALIAVGRFAGEAFGRFVVKPLRTWNKRRVTYDELMGLDDHMLRDLGITRGQIAGVAVAAAEGAQTVREMTAGEIANRNEPVKAA